MSRIQRILAAAAALWLAPLPAFSQSFAAVGTRATGMGGAFVGVADDASAIYWNPAGLASGTYFSLVVDGGAGEATPDLSPVGSSGSGSMIGLAMPALGLGYYRLRSTLVVPPPSLLAADGSPPSRNLTAVAELRLDTLITHHAGITLVQSIYPGITVGSSLKLVRGIAGSTHVLAGSAEEALETEEAELLGRATNKFDLDVGVMAAGGPLKVGLTLRNLTEPSFEAAGDVEELTLERQARAGLSYSFLQRWVAAADFDLLKTRDAFGDRRDIAVGVEGRLGSRAQVRTGASINTVDADFDGSRRQAYSIGGSYAVKGSVYVDAQFTGGSDPVGQQWGVAARFVY